MARRSAAQFRNGAASGITAESTAVARGEAMGAKEGANTALMRRWYDEMWAEMNFALIPELAGPIYVRHHSRGATDPIRAEDYARIAAAGAPGTAVTDFAYRLVADGDHVGSIGRMEFDTGVQWDWVQLFRIEDGRIVETWLPGMGGNSPRVYPNADAAWTGAEVPESTGAATGTKAVLARWYDEMWAKCAFDLVPAIAGPVYLRHDMSGAANPLTSEQYRDALTRVGADWEISDFRYFLIGQDDLVIATASWTMGKGRQWDWVQAFRIADGRMVETWLPALGGTDPMIRHSPDTRWPREVIPAPFHAPRPA
ncbi:nuclear transport factor 2 family protein [Pseudonocardia ailaonensis]|uniref:nuclear transport factor 2 family protein n=1 Tax=Pseudonocardia ailaonensis TaxID=367279 RepID=UPI0031D5A088